MDYQVITKADFSDYRDISSNIDAARVDPYIFEAQTFDIRPILGPELYVAFLTEAATSPPSARITRLLDGEDYTPTGETYPKRFYGLKPALIYFSYARFLENQNFNLTRSGLKFKNFENSERVSDQTLSALVTTARNKGIQYGEEAVKWLIEYESLFPEFDCRKHTQRSGARFFNVNRKRFF